MVPRRARKARLALAALAAATTLAPAAPATAQVPTPPGVPIPVVPGPPVPPGPPAVYPFCTSQPSYVSLPAGRSTTVTVTCSGDPSVAYVLKLVDSAGLGVEVTPGSLPGSYAVKLTAPATAEEDYGSVGLTLEGGPFPVTVSIPVSVIPPPLPECYAPRGVEIPAGTTAQIYVECETRGDGGDGRDATPVVEVVEGPKHGKLGKPRRGEGWSYTPDRGFTGTDTIRIKAHNDYGALPVLTISIRVRKPTRYELDAAYVQRVCAEAPPETSCRAGRGRRTLGGAGTGKVSHRNWPAITGVYLSYYDQGGGRIEGAERNDELLGHHGSDTIFGGAGSDVLWGDWDPEDNNGTQRDTLNGGAGSDFIYTSHGRNTVSGGAGNDFIWAFYGHGTIDCGPGNDKVRLSGRRSAYRLRSCERRGTF